MVITIGDVGPYNDGTFGLKKIRGRFTDTRGGAGDQGNTVFDANGHACSGIVKRLWWRP